MRKRIDPGLAALVLFALILRFWDAMATPVLIGDEVVHVPAAFHYVTEGRFFYNWQHPPLYNLLTYASIKLFGDNPYGWRALNILCGSLSVGVLVALGKRLFADRRIAYLAGAFFAIEPMHILLSRTSFIDVVPVFLFLCSVYGVVRYREDRARSLGWAGAALGLALACKWYYLVPLMVIIALLLVQREDHPSRVWRERSYILTSFLIIPAGAYLLTYAPWFAKGHDLLEFAQLQQDMYHQLRSLDLGDFYSDFLQFMPATAPWRWFLLPLISGSPIVVDGAFARHMVFMNNPPVWLLAIPAAAWSLYQYRQTRSGNESVPALLFLATYLQFAAAGRPIFLYSAIVVLPFVYLMASAFLMDLCARVSPGAWPFRMLIALVLGWGMYLYPFISGMRVPMALYAPLLKLGRVFTF